VVVALILKVPKVVLKPARSLLAGLGHALPPELGPPPSSPCPLNRPSRRVLVVQTVARIEGVSFYFRCRELLHVSKFAFQPLDSGSAALQRLAPALLFLTVLAQTLDFTARQEHAPNAL
jgi:hypothetical protein